MAVIIKNKAYHYNNSIIPQTTHSNTYWSSDGLTLSESDVCIRQILTYTDAPHAERIKICLMAVDPYHRQIEKNTFLFSKHITVLRELPLGHRFRRRPNVRPTPVECVCLGFISRLNQIIGNEISV